MCWDLPNPQFKLCRHMRLSGATGCTSLSYSPDGKVLYAAFSDPQSNKACGVTAWDSSAQRGRVVYRREGAALYHLVPSPDGRRLAWVETYRRRRGKPRRGPDVIVFDLRAGKCIYRIGLSADIPAWLDAQPPVWTADSRTLCYGDVIRLDRMARRQVLVLTPGQGDEKRLLRDALAVGAVAGGIVLNRGPACTPMAQLISSQAPVRGLDDRPKSNDIVLCDPARPGTFVTLMPNAFAQQASGRHVVYARESGGDVIVTRAELKRPGAGPKGR
jgi:hypothetical protein